MAPLSLRLYPIFEFIDSMLAGTMGTTVKDTFRFHTMTDDSAATMRAGRCQGMNRTFETIKDMRLASDPHFEAFIVHVTAYFTSHIIRLLIHHLPLSLIHFYSAQLEPF